MSDFPEFDRAYKTVLVKDLEDRFEQLAAQANFNIYHSDIWRGTARKFAESIVKECCGIYDKIDNGNPHMDTEYFPEAIHKHFGLAVKKQEDQ